jgi:AraC-like DNA-binding protein
VRKTLPPDLSTETAPERLGVPASPPLCTRELVDLVGLGAVKEGCNEADHPGLRFYRISGPITFRKMQTLGPTFTVVAQGRKVSRFRGHVLEYDPCRYLVITGESECQGTVVEATKARPYLAFNMDIPADVVAKTLLALADSAVEPLVESAPAFVSGLDASMKDAVLRLLRALRDPLERHVLVPLIIEEIVFRLLRSDAAALVRSAVSRDRDEGIRQAMRFMRENSSRALSIDQVARHVAMSPSHFAHRFRAVARMTPMRYLKQLRMYTAREMLLSSGVRVGEAAARVGYESSSHFSRDFKRYFGSTPADYLRRIGR